MIFPIDFNDLKWWFMPSLVQNSFGCEHIKRGCQLVAPCCSEVYTCKKCHDIGEDHLLKVRDVYEVVCFHCNLRQPVERYCSGCGLEFGPGMYCKECVFFSTTKKPIFHCYACDACCKGERRYFQHCYRCQICYDVTKIHSCIPAGDIRRCSYCTMNIPAIVGWDNVVEMPCHHLYHKRCYHCMLDEGRKFCKQCDRTAVVTKQVWLWKEFEVKALKMPESFKNIYRKTFCTDCKKTHYIKYHVAGMKCVNCGSFNTEPLGPLSHRIVTEGAVVDFLAGIKEATESDDESEINPAIIYQEMEFFETQMALVRAILFNLVRLIYFPLLVVFRTIKAIVGCIQDSGEILCMPQFCSEGSIFLAHCLLQIVLLAVLPPMHLLKTCLSIVRSVIDVFICIAYEIWNFITAFWICQWIAPFVKGSIRVISRILKYVFEPDDVGYPDSDDEEEIPCPRAVRMRNVPPERPPVYTVFGELLRPLKRNLMNFQWRNPNVES